MIEENTELRPNFRFPPQSSGEPITTAYSIVYAHSEFLAANYCCAGGTVTAVVTCSLRRSLSVRIGSGALPDATQSEQNSMEQRLWAGRTAGDVDVNRNDSIYSAHRGVIRSEDASADATRTAALFPYRP